jgi:hypothetical protein
VPPNNIKHAQIREEACKLLLTSSFWKSKGLQRAVPIEGTTAEIAEVEMAKMQKQCLNSS